ncbi:MAG: autotransporter-associated beta strand repeat-containing protein, partial [Akkermansiaceae bacterium]|nr:autotransporter-associated beta strand repeat-containing protein [Verrucomicrobiales bacterium]
LILDGTLNVNNVTANLNGLSGSGVVENLGANAVSLFIGNNSAGGVFNGSFQNSGGGALTLVKIGGGTLTLGGAGSHTGSTIISNGVLALSASASLSSTTNIMVGTGSTFNVSALSGSLFNLTPAQTLSGNGTVQGSVADSSSSILAPGTSGTAGTLTISGGLALTGGGILSLDLANSTTPGSGVNDLIVVGGLLDLSAPTTLSLNYLGGTPGVGVYTLLQYGSFAGNVANLTAPLGFSITNNTAAKTIGLVVNHSPASLTWLGDGAANIWDDGITANWLQAGTNQVFLTGDSVTFDNSGSSTPAVSIASTLFPSAVTVNSSQNYNFTGATIASGSLTKSGSGTLTLENNNTYQGPTVINAGVLQVGNGGVTGSLGTGPTTNNAALIFNRADDLTYAGAISGTGGITNIGSSGTVVLSGSVRGSDVTMSGTGGLGLSGSNSYTGLTLVTSGTLFPRNGSALGTTNVGTIVQDGAQLYIDANVNIGNEPLTIAGAANLGAFRKGGGGASIFGGAITLTADTTFQNDGGTTLNLTNAAGITGVDFNLTLNGDGGSAGFVAGPITLGTGALSKGGGGSWTIAATNTYTGKTLINGGTLRISSPASLGPVGVWTPDYVTLNGGSLGANTNIVFDDALRGITAVAGGFNVDPGFSLTISNDIAGSGTLTKSGAGTLVLIGAHSFSGNLNVDTASTGGSDGVLRIASPNAIANVLSPILIRNNNSASSTFQLDGSGGNITLAQEFRVNCRANAVPAFQNLSGNNTLNGLISLTEGGNLATFQSDAGLLTLAGGSVYIGAIVGPRSYNFVGAGDFLVSAPIQIAANGSPINLIKGGTGTLTLSADNTYGNATTVSNGVLLLTGSITSTGAVTVVGGTLAGTGSINDNVTVQAGGTLSPGLGGAIGTLTINGNLTLAGTTAVDINKTAVTRDQVSGLANVTYGGTLVVSNLAGTLNLGDSFTVFNTAAHTGNFTSVTGNAGPGRAFSFDPALGAITIIAGTATTPTNITFSVSGGNLTLDWPQSHVGWILQSQTNALSAGLGTNWVDVASSSTTNSVSLPINSANPTVFFRLRAP